MTTISFPASGHVARRVHAILEGTSFDHLGRSARAGLVALILANVAAFVLETVEPIHRAAPTFFRWFEAVSVAIFTIEYLLRLWSCTVSPSYAGPVLGRLRFALTPMAIVDLLAILPFYLPFAVGDLRVLRTIRMLRLLRLAKLGRYSIAVRTIGAVLAAKRAELAVTLGGIAVVLLFASSLVYFAERDAQPDKFSSIPAAMRRGVVTLTTIGYGDVYPVTVLGKCFAAVIALLGVGTIALPAAILGSAFMSQLGGGNDSGNDSGEQPRAAVLGRICRP
jgi:voltage-gated potassium channel